MKKTLKGLAFGIVAFVIWLVFAAPARLLVPYLPPHIALTDLGGTVWAGYASDVNISGVDVGRIEWRLNPLPLIVGNINVRWDTAHPDLAGNGVVTYSSKKIELESVSLRSNGGAPDPVSKGLGFPLTGAMDMQLDALTATPEGPLGAQGRIVWNNTALAGPSASLRLGTVQADAVQKDDTMVIKIGNKDASVRVDGEIQIRRGWQYTTQLRLTPTAQASAEVRRSVSLLGRRDTKGRVVVNKSGVLSLSQTTR